MFLNYPLGFKRSFRNCPGEREDGTYGLLCEGGNDFDNLFLAQSSRKAVTK